VRDGDEWVVNGQKVWTSQAHHSDWAMLLTRTDPEAPKHRGITYFLVDMRTPGIEVVPLRQITGAAHFNEVFLTDVRIPHANVLGEVNGGWAVAMTTLTNERGAIGAGTGQISFDEVRAAAAGRRDDPVIRQELAKAYTRAEIMRFLGYRMMTALSRGELPGPETSVSKLHMSAQVSHLGDLLETLAGAGGMLDCDAAHSFLGQWASKIGGGTDEIQRNVIGERVLGLPTEPRVDKDVPFKELSGSASAVAPGRT
jgi:alkylation response protein AidB-like acyl-CoA dehydrogenase